MITQTNAHGYEGLLRARQPSAAVPLDLKSKNLIAKSTEVTSIKEILSYFCYRIWVPYRVFIMSSALLCSLFYISANTDYDVDCDLFWALRYNIRAI